MTSQADIDLYAAMMAVTRADGNLTITVTMEAAVTVPEALLTAGGFASTAFGQMVLERLQTDLTLDADAFVKAVSRQTRAALKAPRSPA